MDHIHVTRRGRTALAIAAGTVLMAVAAQIPATAHPAGHPGAAAASVARRSSISTGAYDDTTTKTRSARPDPSSRTALHRIISSTQTGKLSYSQVWDALKDTDQDPANSANVILLYTGRSQSEDDNGGGADQWNREHVWAKSHGDFGTGDRSGHRHPPSAPGGRVRQQHPWQQGLRQGRYGGRRGPGNYTDDDSFEPRDEVKGDVARMILYMAVRYDGDDGFPDLEPNDKVDNGSASRTSAGSRS